MINFKLFFIALSCTLLLVASTSALAYTPQRGNVHTILGPLAYKTNYGGVAAKDALTFQGLSWIILGDVSDKGSVKITTNFMEKVFFLREGDYVVSEKAKVVQASAGYMYWVNEHFGTSLSLYTSYPLGDSEKIYDNFPASMNTPKTTAHENSETGLDLSLHGQIFKSGRYALIAEGRYQFSFTKKSNEFADQYGFLIGIRYFFQGKDTPRE